MIFSSLNHALFQKENSRKYFAIKQTIVLVGAEYGGHAREEAEIDKIQRAIKRALNAAINAVAPVTTIRHEI